MNSGNNKGVDTGWEFLAQSLMRLCNGPEQRAGLGKNWPGKMLTWIVSQNWFRMDLQSSSRGHKEGSNGERLREGSAPAHAGDICAYQAIVTTVVGT